ncbi:MAG TPA: protein kinase [Chthoniobacter sp.]|jgi:serine/threonine protein kinase/TPR repeat protein
MPDTAIFDHYEVLTRDDGSLFELGRGAMGITYKAFDTSLRIPVALKVINATYLNSEVARQRFVREARSAAQLRHRNVASVFHLGTEGDTWFYAMEFIDGETLDAVIKRQGPLSPAIALTISGQVARALNAAAQHGLVHRDIKPANLMLVKEDDELVAKVIDFGLAKAAVVEGEEAATLSMGGFVGTPHFASPEQLEEKEIDTRSDIYSLGVTLWYMLAGQAPFAGSMAQVMSQHLTKPPPFEKLDKLPPAVAEVLRKMLAKDPADRYQTPADLRKAIEQALENLGTSGNVPATGAAGSSTAPASVAESQEDFATLLEDSSSRVGLPSFETNTTIANRYRVASSCGETNAGNVFRAYDTEHKTEVRLIVLHPEALNDTLALAALEREVERLLPVKHANLLGVLGFETVDRGSFLVLEWTEGFSLLDLLKARRELDADEALKLLGQAAEGADHALDLGLCGLEFGLHQIQIHFPGEIEKEKLLRTPLKNWPEFFVKLYPLGATREFAASQTWAGAQTMVASCGEASEAPSGDVRPQYVQSLAAVTYELLGGTLSPVALRAGGGAANPRYTPLSTLSEEGNEVLHRALDCGRSYPSVREFSAALAKLDGLQIHRHESKTSLSAAPVARTTTTAKPAPMSVPPPVSKAAPPVSRPPIPQTPASTPPKQKGAPVVLMAGIAAALLVVAAVAFYFYHAKSHSTADSGGSATSASASENPSTDGPASSTQPVADSTPVATPIPATPMPVATPIPATPIPGPTRQDLLKVAVTAAQDLEEKGDWPRSLAAWMSIAHDYQDFPVGRNHLETMLNHLRDRPAPISFEEFQSMRGPIIEAAQMGILSAMLLIGDNLRVPEPKIAAHWFSMAADKGDTIGLVQYGLMLRKGEGVDKADPETAFSLFQKAADSGDPNGKLELGECYLHGIGVIADEKHGVDLIREVAQTGNTRGMNELGFCYSHGLGLERDYHAAFQWFSKSSEKGNFDATANLGVLYMNGWGAEANAKKGIELFKSGAEAGHATCMQLYASALEAGRGTDKNHLLATSWYRKAAKAGSKTAIDWCNSNAVAY